MKKKELKIKYELENNLRLVSFKNQRIEISFNSNLDKSFIKDLSAKLLEWTNVRWIITFSQEILSKFKRAKKSTKKLFKKEIDSQFSKDIKKIFSDAELLKIYEQDRYDRFFKNIRKAKEMNKK